MDVLDSITLYPPFNGISDHALKDIIDDQCSLVTIPPFTLITGKGDKIDRIGYILSGTIDLMGDSEKGEPSRKCSLGKGEYFGVELAFDNGLSLFDEVTMEQVSCLVMEKETFLFVLRRYPRLKQFFETALIDKLKYLHPMEEAWKRVGNQTEYRRVKKAIEFIDTRYTENICLDDVARITGLSRFHFSRLFNQVTGHTFKDYLNLKRLEAAKKLLLLPEINISQACFSVGFNDASYFARLFKKYEGISPSSFRKTGRKSVKKKDSSLQAEIHQTLRLLTPWNDFPASDFGTEVKSRSEIYF